MGFLRTALIHTALLAGLAPGPAPQPERPPTAVEAEAEAPAALPPSPYAQQEELKEAGRARAQAESELALAGSLAATFRTIREEVAAVILPPDYDASVKATEALARRSRRTGPELASRVYQLMDPIYQDLDRPLLGRMPPYNAQEAAEKELAAALRDMTRMPSSAGLLIGTSLYRKISLEQDRSNAQQASTHSPISPQEVQAFFRIDARAEFEKKKAGLLSALDGRIKAQAERQEQARKRLEAVRQRVRTLTEALSEGQSQIDKKIIVWGLPLFGVVLLLILVIPRLYPSQGLQDLIFSSGLALDIFTVFLLTVTILLLGLAGKLKPELLGTLIGGISGFVLGRSFGGRQRAGDPPRPPVIPPRTRWVVRSTIARRPSRPPRGGPGRPH